MEQKKKRLSILKKSVRYESSPTQTFTKSNRRISFSGTKSVKEFIAGEDKATIWGTSYEEEDKNHASIASAQESCLPDMSTTIANASYGIMLRNRRIVPNNFREDNKENLSVETTYDTMELANTQHIATTFDNRTFNNTMDLTLNSFELKHIKFSKPALYTNIAKNVEATTEEIGLNFTSPLEMDSDISQNMYCSFVNEQDRKMVLQHRLANKANNTNMIGKFNESNISNRFECEIDNFTFEPTYPDNARQILVDKSNSDTLNKSLASSPMKLNHNNMPGKIEFGRKTIVFPTDEIMDESYEVPKQIILVDNGKPRKTILLNEELDMDNILITKNVEMNENKISEPSRGVSESEDMIIDTIISHSQQHHNPENDGKRETIIFTAGENVNNESDHDEGFCALDAHRRIRKTVVFPMGETLQTDNDSYVDINPCQIIKSRQTLLFEGGQKINEDQAATYSYKVPSDLKQKSFIFSGVDIEAETSLNETDQKCTNEKSSKDLLCPNDGSRKTLIFRTGENIDVSFYKSPLLRAQSKRMTQMFQDTDMEVEETFSEFNNTKAEGPSLNIKLSNITKSRHTQIFPKGEKINETMDSSLYLAPASGCTTNELNTKNIEIKSSSQHAPNTFKDQQKPTNTREQFASKPEIFRQTLIFERGELIDAHYFTANPEEARRKTQLFRDDNIELDICSSEKPTNIQKESRIGLNDCTMDETLCMNQGQNMDISLSIFSKIQQKQAAQNAVSEKFCNESGIELLEQCNQSMKNPKFDAFVETIRADESDRHKNDIKCFKEEEYSTNKSVLMRVDNRKTIVFSKGEELDIAKNDIVVKNPEKPINSSKNVAQSSVATAEYVDFKQLDQPKERRTLILKNDNMNIDDIEIQPHENASECKTIANRKTIVFSKGENIMEIMDESRIADKNRTCNKDALTNTTISVGMLLTSSCENLSESFDHAIAARRVLVFDTGREKQERHINVKTSETERRATCVFDNEDIKIEDDPSIHTELQKDNLFEANKTTNREHGAEEMHLVPPNSLINKSSHNEMLNKENVNMKTMLKSSLASHHVTLDKSTFANTKYVHENIDTSFQETIPMKSSQICSDDQKHTRRTIVYQQGEPVDLSESIAVKANVSQTSKGTVVTDYASSRNSSRSKCFQQTKIMLEESFAMDCVKNNQEQITDKKEHASKSEHRRATIVFRNGENIEEEDAVVHEAMTERKSRIPIPSSSKIPQAIPAQAKAEQYDSLFIDNRKYPRNIGDQNPRKTQIFQNEIIQTDSSSNTRLERNMERKTVITSSPGKHFAMEKDKSKLVAASRSEERIPGNKNIESSLFEMTLDEQKIDNKYPPSEVPSNSQKTRRTIYFNEEIDEESEQSFGGTKNSRSNKIFYSQPPTSAVEEGLNEAHKSELRDSSVRLTKNTNQHEVKPSNILDQSQKFTMDKFVKPETQISVGVSNKDRRTFTIPRDIRIESSGVTSDKALDTFVVSKNSGSPAKDIAAEECSILILDTSELPTREISSSLARSQRGAIMTLQKNENRKSSDVSHLGKTTFTIYEDRDQTLKPDESRGFENNSPSATFNNPNLFKKLTQDSIYLSRTACCPMGPESLLATGSSLTFSPNSTAALCNLDPNKITGAGYKRSFSKNGVSDDTFYKQFKRDYAELTIDAIRASPDQYEVVADEITADDIDKTHIDLVDTIETISDSCDKIEVCEASVMLLNVVEGNQDNLSYMKGKAIAIEQSQMLCHKCKNCQKTTLNDTTLAGFNLEKDLPDVELNFDAFTKLEGKPRFRDVLHEFKERRLSNCFNSTYEESILFPTVPSAQFLLDNYAEGYMQHLEEENPTDGLNGAVCPVIPPYEVLFQNRLRERSPWIFDDSNLPIGLLRCRHKTVRGICLTVKFQPQDLQNPEASNVSFNEILMEKCNIYKNPSVFDRVVHNEIFSRMSRDLTAFCCSSNQLFSFLDSVDILFDKSRQLAKKLLKTIFLNYALLKCDESGNCIVRKTVCDTTDASIGSKLEFQIRIRNVEKMCADDILLPPRSYFKNDVQSLPKGLDFIEIFLRDPIKYLK